MAPIVRPRNSEVFGIWNARAPRANRSFYTHFRGILVTTVGPCWTIVHTDRADAPESSVVESRGQLLPSKSVAGPGPYQPRRRAITMATPEVVLIIVIGLWLFRPKQIVWQF